MGSFGKISIGLVIFLFVAYLISHYLIGKRLEQLKKENEEKPGNKTLEKNTKNLGLLFKWYPALYLVLTILILYAQ